jgi:hypothetical protein
MCVLCYIVAQEVSTARFYRLTVVRYTGFIGAGELSPNRCYILYNFYLPAPAFVRCSMKTWESLFLDVVKLIVFYDSVYA